MSKEKEPSFEEDLEKLEAIVEALEEGGLPLAESLKRFEEGIKLSRRCERTLTEAEKKIEILTRNATGELEARAFDETPEAQAEGVDNAAGPDAADEASDEEAAGDAAEDDEGSLLF